MSIGNNKVAIEVNASVTGEPAIGELGATLDSTAAKAKKLGTDAGSSAAGINQADTASQGYTATSAKLRDGMDSISSQLAFLTKAWAAYTGAVQFAGMIKDAYATADAYNNLQARIKLVTGEGAGFVTAFEGITEVAKRTSTSLESTGTLFTKLAAAGKEMGYGQEKALQLTETINQAVQLSGSSAQASEAALTQLIQSLQSGVFRGDEFNSVMEQAPRLSKAVADGLGVATGELRKMAEAGTLTSDVVIKSLTNQSAIITSEFAKLPPTVGRALQGLATQWTLYVGEADKASGSSALAAKAIGGLSDNLKTVAGLLFDAGKAALAYTAYKLADTFIATSVAAAGTARDLATATAATAASTAAAEKNTAALAANKIERDAMGVAITRNAAALTGNAAAMTDLATGLAATSTRYGENKVQMAAMGAELAATTGKTIATTAEVGLMGKTISTIGTVAGGAFGLAGMAVKGFASLLGGIPGIALMILVNVKEIGTWMGEFVAKHTSWGNTLAANEAKIAAINAEEKKRITEKIAAQKELDAANDKAVSGSAKLVKAAEDYIPVIEKEVKTVEAQAKATVDLIKVSGDEVQALKVGVEQAEIVATVRAKAAAAADALVKASEAQIAAIKAQTNANGELSNTQKAQIVELEKKLVVQKQDAEQSGAAALAAKIEAAARAVLSDAYKDNSNKVIAYAQEVANAKAKLDILEKSGVASLQQIQEAQLGLSVATAKYKDALADTAAGLTSDIELERTMAIAKLEAAQATGKLGKELQAQLELAKAQAQASKDNSDRLWEYKGAVAAATAEVERLIKAHDAGKATDDQVREAKLKLTTATLLYRDAIKDTEAAYHQLGIKTPQELTNIADANAKAWDKIKNDASLSTQALKTAFTTYAQSAIAAAGSVDSAQYETTKAILEEEAQVQGLTLAFDRNGQVAVRSQDDAARGFHGTRDAVDAVTSALERENAVLEAGIAAQEKALDLAERKQALEDKANHVNSMGMALDRNGNVITGTTTLLTKSDVYEKAKAAGLNDAGSNMLAEKFGLTPDQVAAARKDPYLAFQRNFDIEGFLKLLNELLAEQKRAADLAAKRAKDNTLPSGNNTTPASASYIVNLVINGTSTVVHVASDADAQALINALRAAKLSAGS